MDINDIKTLIASDESRTLELKKTTGELKDGMHSACAFLKSTYLENWGSGAKRIIDACRKQGVEEPVWRWDGGFVIVTFKRPNKTNFYATLGEEQSSYRSTTAQPPLNYRSTTAQVQKMILAMGDGYFTMSEIMANMDLKHRTSFRENYFLPALKDGAIEPMYPNQPNHPKQKYCLTEAAKKWKTNSHAE